MPIFNALKKSLSQHGFNKYLPTTINYASLKKEIWQCGKEILMPLSFKSFFSCATFLWKSFRLHRPFFLIQSRCYTSHTHLVTGNLTLILQQHKQTKQIKIRINQRWKKRLHCILQAHFSVSQRIQWKCNEFSFKTNFPYGRKVRPLIWNVATGWKNDR